MLEGVARSGFLECIEPQGALYAFPAIRSDVLPEFDDEAFALRLLEAEHALVVPGSSFNLPDSRHFRMTLLPEAAQIAEVLARIERTLTRMADSARRRHVA